MTMWNDLVRWHLLSIALKDVFLKESEVGQLTRPLIFTTVPNVTFIVIFSAFAERLERGFLETRPILAEGCCLLPDHLFPLA